jgi:hypothetical protein
MVVAFDICSFFLHGQQVVSVAGELHEVTLDASKLGWIVGEGRSVLLDFLQEVLGFGFGGKSFSFGCFDVFVGVEEGLCTVEEFD